MGFTLTSCLQGSLLLPGDRASAQVACRGRTQSSLVLAEPEGRRRFTAQSAPGLRSVSREVGAAELGCQRASRCCAPSGSWKRPRRCARGCRTRGLNLPRAGRGAGPGAGRGCEARAGRGEGCGRSRTFPPLYLSPTSPPPLDLLEWRRGCRLLEDNGHPRSPPSPTSPGLWLLSEAKPAGAPSGTKRSGGVLSVKRGPRSVAVRTVRENNGTPPAPGTLVLTLVFPPLPVLPNPPSSAGLRRGGRGPAGKKGHRPGRRSATAAPWGLPGSRSSREGRGGSRAVSVQPAPLASCRQNPERGSDARETRGRRLRACGTQRNADAAGFSCLEGGVSSPSRSVRD